MAEANTILERCLELFAEDKVFQASRLEKELLSKYPQFHAENADKLKRVIEMGAEAEKIHAEFASVDGWTVVRQAKNEHDVGIWFRQEAGSAMHTFRMEGHLDAAPEYLLVLMNEITLYGTWLPFIGGSSELSSPSRCERYFWLKVWSPTPAIIHHRDACIYARAIDGLDEDGCVLVLLRTFADGEDGVAHPKPEPRTTRVAVKFGACELVPTAQGKTRVRFLAHVDP
eukprot:CAMPEP_0113670622 /NCGR_PEP_ID=MMETSP0038_2-20120614/5243_1 /TAXON_ID=2898 /ORGANISM="Cryptomonas paramecium" /LENGTH=227 /DNA_ID=CAMNT_0000586667 /DNA_START=1 /DNA_END=681 /DNA_ORIENTATION=+ /assembly_acc=CAM_ASM_000170